MGQSRFLRFLITWPLSIKVLVHTSLAEFKKVMEDAIKILEEEVMLDTEPISPVLPPFALRASLPKLSGLNAAKYAGLLSKQLVTRSTRHMEEMETQHVPLFLRLIEKAK